MIKRKFNYCECDAENNYTWNLGVASTTTDRTDYRIKCCITYEFLIVLVWKLEEMKGGTNPYISQIRTKKSVPDCPLDIFFGPDRAVKILCNIRVQER